MAGKTHRKNDQKTKRSQEPGRRAEISAKAHKIFMRHGYHKTTIEDIGKACGLGKAALYYYFPSKEAIFVEVVRTESAEILRQITKAIEAVEDPRKKLSEMIKTRFKLVSDIMEDIIGRDLGEELLELLPMAAMARQEFFSEEANLIRQILTEGQRQGVFKEIPSPELPLLIISAIRGIELHFAEIQQAPSQDDAIDLMTKLFFEGICQ
ncbi:MAG: TetR/AcrR family transcriptional regulator [Deltaproteobacteria bacterium]|nr:TetR/AcrR family transcriptional regulator [Deltaproteobacteria bacterium]